MMVLLPLADTCHSAHAHTPLPLPHLVFDTTIIYSILPQHPAAILFIEMYVPCE